MFFWFAGLAFVLVAVVFESPNLDFRLVMFGAVLPSLESLIGSPWMLHTLAMSVAVFAAIALIFQGKRLVQRRWIGLAIGMFFHLVLDGTWANTKLFWWPAFGNVLGEGRTPELERGWLLVVMELIGIAVLVWLVNTRDLRDPENARRFLKTGHLPRQSSRQPGTGR